MARIVFPKGEQAIWLNKILEETQSSVNEIAKNCKVSARTFRDWRREKYTISQNALLKLQKVGNLSIPLNIQILPDFWYVIKGARKGALKRMKLYGALGDIESRRKGGKISQQKRKENPEKYRRLGCIVKKTYKIDKPTTDFAELTGILLGDGGITDNQMRITVSSLNDRLYAEFIYKLIYKVLGEYPSVYERIEDHTIRLTISGIGLVDILMKWGLVKGNKIIQKIDFPGWIWEQVEFQKACVRGLIDTDGGLYFHKHWIKGIKYRNLGLCFTSFSPLLIKSVAKVLSKFDIKYSILSMKRIYIYNLSEIKKYFFIFDTNNPKNKEKLEFHLTNSKILRKIT